MHFVSVIKSWTRSFTCFIVKEAAFDQTAYMCFVYIRVSPTLSVSDLSDRERAGQIMSFDFAWERLSVPPA